MIPYELTFRLLRFSTVGATGVVVNMGLLILLTEGLGLPYAISSLFAIEASILSNFALNNAWTWADRRESPLGHRLLKYHTVAGMTALGANWCLLIILTHFFHIDYRISNLIGIVAGILLNFVLNHVWTFRSLNVASAAASGPALASAPADRTDPFKTCHPDGRQDKQASWLAPFSSALVWKWMGALLLLTALKVFLAHQAELLPEEAYYWTYLQFPALGYFDHPPMVAWVIGVGTFLFGDAQLTVRLGTILLSLGSSFLIFLLGRMWFDQWSAWWAAALFNLLPLFLATGTLAFPDGPLIFFWLLTMYAVSKALGIGREEGGHGVARVAGTKSYALWILAGVGLGGALLSKYTGIMLAPSLALFLLASPRHRHWLRRPHPWLALAVGLVVFSPVILWNAQHDWASFLFQSTRTSGQPHEPFKNALNFWLIQLGVLGPVPFILLGTTAWRSLLQGLRGGQSPWLFAFSFFMPMFAVFFLASFKTEIHVNWTAPCWLSLILASPAVFREGLNHQLAVPPRLCRLGAWSVVVLAAAIVGLVISTLVWNHPVSMVYSHGNGWRELAQLVRTAEEDVTRTTGQKPFILGEDKFNTAAEMGFYLSDPTNQVNNFALGKHGLGYRYWTPLNQWEGRSAIVIMKKTNPKVMARLQDCFESVESPQLHHLQIPEDRTVWLVTCHGYKPKAAATAHDEPSTGED